MVVYSPQRWHSLVVCRALQCPLQRLANNVDTTKAINRRAGEARQKMSLLEHCRSPSKCRRNTRCETTAGPGPVSKQKTCSVSSFSECTLWDKGRREAEAYWSRATFLKVTLGYGKDQKRLRGPKSVRCLMVSSTLCFYLGTSCCFVGWSVSAISGLFKSEQSALGSAWLKRQPNLYDVPNSRWNYITHLA